MPYTHSENISLKPKNIKRVRRQAITPACASTNIIPGLDAELCRCDACKVYSPDGLWWVDLDQRADCLNKRKHKHPYLQQVYATTETGVDHDQETKETKAQASKRKHAAWAGQKLKATAKQEVTAALL